MRLVGFICAAIAIAVIVGQSGGPDDVSASHPYPKFFLWPDLQPGGDAHVQYNVCGDGTPGEANWNVAIEAWDAALGPTMDFDPAACAAGGRQARIRWESVANECGGFIACWDPANEVDMGSYWRLTEAEIWVDKGQFTPYGTSWQQFIVAHEWGHVLSLDHHTTTGPCAERSVMAYLIGADPATCGMVMPTPADRDSVQCAVYWQCAPGAAAWGCYGRLDVFVRGSDNKLYQKWSDIYNPWPPQWTNLQGNITSAPAGAAPSCGRQDIFARGTNGTAWHIWEYNGWHPWEDILGGNLASGPGAASWRCSGRLDVFTRGTDSKLWQKWSDNTHPWSQNWTDLQGDISSAPAGASPYCGRQDVFAQGPDGQIRHRYEYNGWQPWETFPGVVSSAPGASSWRCSGRLDLFAKGPDNTLWHKWSDNTHPWSPWESLGGSIASAPAAASPYCGRTDVFARRSDGVIMHIWEYNGWQPWETVLGTAP